MPDETFSESKTPWVSFCMSTFQRPALLRKQIGSLLQQSFTDFEIIISDNDPLESARTVAESFTDSRIRYFSNGVNLGMIKSYNKSIGRSTSDYVVMVTDDDPVEENFLQLFYDLVQSYPGLSVYGGFGRVGKKPDALEVIAPEDFLPEILHPEKTNNMLWSSCLVRRKDLLSIGGLPDYGSPHLFDHAMLAMAGTRHGGVMINKMYSEYILHDANFSKSNFNAYYISCVGFYETLASFFKGNQFEQRNMGVVKKHLANWFVVNYFSLKKYFAVGPNRNEQKLRELEQTAKRIRQLPYMEPARAKFYMKNCIFFIKRKTGLLLH